MSAAGSAEATAYCAEMLRRQDHERYLTCLFAPASARPALFALYAFNLEVAKTPEAVSEPRIGLVRLRWWRDAVESVYGGRVTPHAVAEALGKAIATHGLSRSHFEHLFDAREADLDAEPPEDLAALETYARDTSARLLWLALEVLSHGREPDSGAKRAAESIGLAWALTGLMRAVPHHARRRKSFLPADMTSAAATCRPPNRGPGRGSSRIGAGTAAGHSANRPSGALVRGPRQRAFEGPEECQL